MTMSKQATPISVVDQVAQRIEAEATKTPMIEGPLAEAGPPARHSEGTTEKTLGEPPVPGPRSGAGAKLVEGNMPAGREIERATTP